MLVPFRTTSFLCRDLRRICLAGGLVVALTVPTHAELWNVYGGVSLETEYSDNKILSTVDENAGFQSIADLQLVAARTGRVNRVTASADFELVRYNSIDFLNDEENLVLRAEGEHDASRTLQFGWYGQFARETTSNRQPRARTLVDENSDFNVDTGLTSEQFRPKDLSFGPNITWKLSENLSLNAAYSYREVDFPEQAAISFNFFDFDRQVAQISASYALNPRHSFSLGARGTRFESNSLFGDDALGFVIGDVETDSIAGDLGYRFDIAENIYLGAVIGFEDVDTNTGFVEFDLDTTEIVYRAYASIRGKASRLLVTAGRSISPSGVGRLLESNLARLVYSYRLSPRQTLQLRASYLSNKPLGVQRDVLDREFLAIEPSYRYNLNRQLSLGLNYRFRNRELRIEGAEADNHSVAANIRYKFGRQKSQ